MYTRRQLPYSADMLIIAGAELTDYTVVVGVGSCIPSSLYHNILKCELPGELPLPGSDYTADPDNADNKLPAVVVSELILEIIITQISKITIPAMIAVRCLLPSKLTQSGNWMPE